MSVLELLSPVVAGDVLAPSDARFSAFTTGFNLAVQHRPEAIVVVESAADVLATVKVALAAGMPVRVQATGHGALRAEEGGILLDTRRLDAVQIDPERRTATLQAGVRWSAVVAAAAPHGLAPITGSAASVGAVGFLLGGGLGPLARSHGFGSDYVESFELVTGHGELVRASATEHADLFWALRGGKGGLGVVTEVVIRLVELPALYAGSLFFDFADAEAVLSGWLAWTKTAPLEVTTSLAAIQFPPLDSIPAPLRGRHLLSLRFAFPGSHGDGQALAAPLRGLAPVVMDVLGPLPIAEVARIHNDPTEPAMSWTRGLMLQQLDSDFVETFVRLLHGPSPLVVAELRNFGGAMRTDVAAGSAVGGRDAEWALMVVGAPDPSLFQTVLPVVFTNFVAALARWVAPVMTINWADENDSAQFDVAWPAETARRLAQVRAAHDPSRIFPYGPR